jgi:hypothetical protein
VRKNNTDPTNRSIEISKWEKVRRGGGAGISRRLGNLKGEEEEKKVKGKKKYQASMTRSGANELGSFPWKLKDNLGNAYVIKGRRFEHLSFLLRSGLLHFHTVTWVFPNWAFPLRLPVTYTQHLLRLGNLTYKLQREDAQGGHI